VASTPKLNDTQLAVLRWIGDGSPAGVMKGHGHRVSAAALRTRGLIKISGRSTTWRANLTPAGQAALGAQPTDRIKAATGRLGPQPKRKATSRATNRSLERIPVPRDLRGAHSLVTATRRAAADARRSRGGLLRTGPQRGVAHIEVSRSLLRRALLVLHGLTKEALGRGWEVVPYPEKGGGGRRVIAIKVRDHVYPVELVELTEPLPLSSEDLVAWQRRTHFGQDGRLSETPPLSLRRTRPTGRLRLVLPNGYRRGRTSWSGGPRGLLETKLGSVLHTLELRAEADDTAAIERARRFEELRREQQARDERARRELIESARLERLLNEVATWRRSEQIRAYVAALEERLPALEADEQVRIARWCGWARECADRWDPSRRTSLIAGRDEVG
jgi:hypothetical protein